MKVTTVTIPDNTAFVDELILSVEAVGSTNGGIVT